MADRLPQYPIMPSNFNPALIQQHQLSQSQPQPQLDPQSTPQFPPSDHGRVWQQQIQQIPNQYRSPSNGDIKGPPLSQPMPDFRPQSLARPQTQQSITQQFGLPQQSPFHDQSSQQVQPHLPHNFQNMTIPNATQPQQQSITPRPVITFAPNNPPHLSSRQLEMIGLTQNQPHQNGSLSYVTRITQQQQQQQQPQQHQHQSNLNTQPTQNPSSQSDLFTTPQAPTPDGIRSSPSHPSQPGSLGNHLSAPPQNPQSLPAGRRHMTLTELRETARQVQNRIDFNTTLIAQLPAQRANMPEQHFLSQMQGANNELNAHKELLGKIYTAMSQFNTANGLPGPSGPSGRNINPSSQSQQPLQQPGPSQQLRIPHGQLQQQNFANNPQINQARPPNFQPSPHQLHAQPIHTQQPNLVPPPPAPTPQQLQGQNPIQMSPNPLSFQLSGQAKPQSRSEHPSQPPPSFTIRPLDKTQFDTIYKNFCATHGVRHDAHLLLVDNHPIDLHSLHVQVVTEGGIAKVTREELWPYIGARMGFVHFPGTDSEPAKSGPGVAQQLAHLYKQHLSEFDHAYVKTVIENDRKIQTQRQLGITGGLPSTRPNAQQMQAMINHANLSAAELRSKGVAEHIIAYIERNRPQLQHSRYLHQQWRVNLQKTPSQTGAPSQPPLEQPPRVSGQSQSQPNPSSLSQGGPPPARFSIPGSSNNMELPFARPPQIPPPTHPQMTTPEHLKQYIARVRHEFMTRSLPKMPPQTIQDDQKMEYNRVVDNLYRLALDMESKLAIHHFFSRQEDTLRKLIVIIMTIRHQRGLLSSPTPTYIAHFSMLQGMAQQLQQALAFCSNCSNIAKQQQLQRQQQQQQQQGPDNEPPAMGPPRPSVSPARMQAPPPPPPQQQQPSVLPGPPQPIPPARSITLMLPPGGKKKPSPIQPGPSPSLSSGTIPPAVSNQTLRPTSTPPAPSALTPVASASTPTPAASSPQEIKSPKTKAAATKPKSGQATKRKGSKNIPPTEIAPPQPVVGSKRPREEDPPSSSSVGSDPSPKRPKTEWEGPPSDLLVKRQEELGNIETEEEAAAFFARVLKMANDDGYQESAMAEAISLVLKGCGVQEDLMDPSAPEGQGSGQQDPPPPPPPALGDDFIEFLDFSSYGALADEESGSKAPTPDLVSSLSTNPSPESASEADGAGHIVGGTDTKVEDVSEMRDPLQLGAFKEIDGGESAFYQHSDWKWDSPMPTLEQPWAIFTT